MRSVEPTTATMFWIKLFCLVEVIFKAYLKFISLVIASYIRLVKDYRMGVERSVVMLVVK